MMQTRITEPFVKISYALWLASKDAENIHVSVDGAEPEPQQVLEMLRSQGYSRTPLAGSKVPWTGNYSLRNHAIRVSCLPGVDVKASMPDGFLVAECKGEPTEKGIKAGTDRTAFYTGIGQLLYAAGQMQKVPQHIKVVLPDTLRMRGFAEEASRNSLLRRLSLGFVLVSRAGTVIEIA